MTAQHSATMRQSIFQRAHLLLAMRFVLILVFASPIAAQTPSHSPSPAEAFPPPPKYDQYSDDTTPVSFSVGGIRYRVPRNYIVHMFNWNETIQKVGSPTLRVTFPELEPFNEKTKTCLKTPLDHHPVGCFRLTFRLSIGHSESTLPDEEAKTRELFEHPRDVSLIKQGPEGFRFIDMGIMQIYFKDSGGKAIFFSCFSISGNLCAQELLTPKGGRLEYLFTFTSLHDIEQIDDKLISLVDSFVIAAETR